MDTSPTVEVKQNGEKRLDYVSMRCPCRRKRGDSQDKHAKTRRYKSVIEPTPLLLHEWSVLRAVDDRHPFRSRWLAA